MKHPLMEIVPMMPWAELLERMPQALLDANVTDPVVINGLSNEISEQFNLDSLPNKLKEDEEYGKIKLGLNVWQRNTDTNRSKLKDLLDNEELKEKHNKELLEYLEERGIDNLEESIKKQYQAFKNTYDHLTHYEERQRRYCKNTSTIKKYIEYFIKPQPDVYGEEHGVQNWLNFYPECGY